MTYPFPMVDEQQLLIATFTLEGKPVGLPASAIREIVRVGDLTPVHEAPEFIVGVVNLRGRIVTVLDLAARVGLGQSTHGPDNRIIIVEWGGEYVGLVVDQVIDVYPIDPMDIAPTPSNVPERLGRYLLGVLSHSSGLVPILEVARVLDDDDRTGEMAAGQAWSGS
jgi:purine-binding chemotaxis protein CheW